MKRILTTMCALTLLLAASVPALAVEPEQSASYYPTSVEEYMEGDSPRIKKVYQLSLADDPSQIPTEDFERDGRLYYLLDMTRKDEVGVDIQTITQTKTLASETNNILTTLNRVVEASNGLQEELAETLRMVCVPGGDGDDLLDLEHELEVLTARQNTLLDQALANMDDLTITEQLKTLLEEKQHLQARIDAVKTEAANRINEDSRMAELTAYLEEHLSGFQQYDDGIVRQLVERITIVDAETIRLKFRYSDVEIEQTMC